MIMFSEAKIVSRGRSSLSYHWIGRVVRSAPTRLLRCQKTAPDHIQVRQCEHRKEPSGVLRQPAIAHFGKAPQALHHVKGMLAAGASSRAQAVDLSMVGTERSVAVGPAVDAVTHSVLLGRDPMHLAPISLVAVQLSLGAMQHLRQLADIGYIGRSRHQRVHETLGV